MDHYFTHDDVAAALRDSRGVVTADDAWRIVTGLEPEYRTHGDAVALRRCMEALGFTHARRRVEAGGPRRYCYVRTARGDNNIYAKAMPRIRPGHARTPDREPADLPPALHDAHGVLSARDAATLGAAPDALRRAGWRRCRARLDGRRQTVYTRPAAGDEHVWPSALPRVRP